MTKKSIFNQGPTLFPPEKWEKHKKEILEKGKAYDDKHDLSTEDKELIREKNKSPGNS